MKTRIKSFLLGATGAMLISTSALAHDTEIYFAQTNVDNPDNVSTANVLFMLDTSGSMAGTRMTALRKAFAEVVESVDDNINIGVGKFNEYTSGSIQGYGGYVFYPVSKMTGSNKEEVIGLVKSLKDPSNYSLTPTFEAYSEAVRYMLGDSVGPYPKAQDATRNNPRKSVHCQAPNQSCNRNATYSSPINYNNQCESNHIIVMTDGAPFESYDADPDSRSYLKDKAGGSTCSGSYPCQERMAEWLYNGGDDEKNNRGRVTRKSIKTWQVGFQMSSGDLDKMTVVAQKGGTDFVRRADDATALADAFVDILKLVDRESRNISSPGVAVSAMNRFRHDDVLLYAVFQPGESSYWEGNLKKYRYATLDPDGNEVNFSDLPIDYSVGLDDDGETYVVVNAKGKVVQINGKDFTLRQAILDANDNEAIDPATGFFKTSAKSIWSNVVDGTDATKGGAREQVSSRKLYYSDANGDTKRWNWNNTPNNNFFGLANNTDRNAMIDELKTMWGDAMHGVPLVVSYGVEKDAAGEPKKDNNGDFIENSYVFISTNGGMLHIIDLNDGKEQAVFMPHETFQKAKQFTIDRPALNPDNNTRALYGLDGSWTVWRKMANNAKIGDKPEKVYIYGGMRRGGSSYYALDVTNPASPKLVWQIKAGAGDFAKLGQTWSTPTQIRVPGPNNTSIPALVFGGGYSPADHDGKKQRTTGDAMGNAIYVVNAETGNLIWKADGSSSANMKWAVPSAISVVDINLDGVVDHFYFGDLGGQVFRVDVKGHNNYSLERIASLSGGGARDSRRFFTAPDIGIFNNQLYVTIASGHHENPLDKDTSDGLFVLFDKSLGSTGSNAATLNLSDLTNVGTGSNVIGSSKGWYYLFKDDSGRWGEKAMSSPAIIDGKVLLATYSPEALATDAQNACTVSYGASYLHVVNLRTGAPEAMNKNLDAPDQRSSAMALTTPPPTPRAVTFGRGGRFIPGVETDPINPFDSQFRKMRWDQLNKTQADHIIDEAIK